MARVRKRRAKERTLLIEGGSSDESGMESPQGTLCREQRKDDFWEAISPDYNYLMDYELIHSCREARGELALDEAGVSPLGETLSSAKFVQQFNELHDWLHELHSRILCCSAEERSDVIARVQGELRSGEKSVKLFVEEAQGLGTLSLSTKEEVNRRMNLLSNKWEAVSKAVEPSRTEPVELDAFQEVAHEMRHLRAWLRELESRIPSQLSGWSCPARELQQRLVEQQAVQKEIESRGRFIRSLLEQCDSLSCSNSAAATSHQPQGSGDTGSASSLPLPPWKAQRFCRVAANLEKRWHGLWLRSLEWQCLLEQLLNTQTGQWESGSDRGHGDEPVSKQPRLSGEWDDHSTTMEVIAPHPEAARTVEAWQCEHDPLQPLWESPNDPPVAAPTHLEKGVMVGTTGITELKAKTRGGTFEIIQDVGYSSESSTQLSSEDCIHVYSYSPKSTTSRCFREQDLCDRPKLDGCWAAEEEEDYKTCPLIQNSGPAADLYRMTSLEPEAGLSDMTSEAVNAILGDDDDWKNGLEDGAGNEKHDSTTSNSSGPLDVSFLTEVGGVRRMKRSLETTKVLKVQEWLERCESSAGGEDDEDGIPRRVDSSCDASGEYTTNEDEDGSDEGDSSSSGSQGRRTSRSMSLSKSGTGSIETVVQVGVSSGGVMMRSGLRSKKRGRERPWSVTDLKQVGALAVLSPFSTSETALNVLLAAASTGQQGGSASEGRPRTCSVGVQKDLSDTSSPEHRQHRQRRPRALRGRALRSDSSSEAVSGSSSARQRRARDVSAASRSGSGGGRVSGRRTASSSGTENYHDCVGISATPAKGFPVHDAVLTHVEEQSSVSDQMWDDYQDPLYCSEPYSEQTADEDQVKKLLDFGDDYRAFIGSHSDTSSLSGLREGPRRVPLKAPRSASKMRVGTDFDSDSDAEDFQHLLEQSVRAYQFIRNTLQKHLAREPKEIVTSKFAELVATCQTNLHCLQVIKVHLHTGGHSPQLEKLISQWEALLTELQRRQSNGDRSEGGGGGAAEAEREAEVLSNIAALRAELDALAHLVRKPSPKMSADLDSHDLPTMEQRVQELKVALSSLHAIRASLLEVKLKVHRLTAEDGSADACFADHVRDLYRQWDDAYELSGAKLTELQGMQSQWGTEDQGLPFEKTARDIAVSDSDEMIVSKTSRASAAAKEDPPGSSGSRLWRILKAALPVQVALVLLYCVACLLEPHCCDLLNNFHASFGPQLSYMQGSPPI